MTKPGGELLDFNLYLGPDDVWHAEPTKSRCACAVAGRQLCTAYTPETCPFNDSRPAQGKET